MRKRVGEEGGGGGRFFNETLKQINVGLFLFRAREYGKKFEKYFGLAQLTSTILFMILCNFRTSCKGLISHMPEQKKLGENFPQKPIPLTNSMQIPFY